MDVGRQMTLFDYDKGNNVFDFEHGEGTIKREVPQKEEVAKPVQESHDTSNKAIKDFGEKIGGAKKDLWKARGLMIDDLLGMNDKERDKFVKKDNIWEKVDYEALVQNGMDVRLAWFIKQVKDSLPAKPIISSMASKELIEEAQKNYIENIRSIRDAVMSYKSIYDAFAFYKNEIEGKGLIERISSYSISATDKGKSVMNNKFLKASQVSSRSLYQYDRDIKKHSFCYSDDEKMLKDYEFVSYNLSNCEWKKDYSGRDTLEVSVAIGRAFYYPQEERFAPEHWKDETIFVTKNHRICEINFTSKEEARSYALNRERGVNELKGAVEEAKKKKRIFKIGEVEIKESNETKERHGRDVGGDDFLADFGFRGGEFGNWVSDKERQLNLNFAYDSLHNLARALDIDPKDISLKNHLSIAFGARGSGSALAHFEPMREVINLTKMRGAGSLAHEWGHALDFILGTEAGLKECFTNNGTLKNGNEAIAKVINVMCYREATEEEKATRKDDNYNRALKNMKGWIKSVLPKDMSNEQQARVDKIIERMEAVCVETKLPFSFDKSDHTLDNKEVAELSALCKEITGHAIPKESRNNIINWQHHLGLAKTNSMENFTVHTDYYKNSEMFDATFSKMGHGYWTSKVEMFARAFACYVQDKLEEKGIHDAYLCGHSEAQVAPFPDKDGNIKIICAFPTGEERKAINASIDEFIEDLKDRDLIKGRESDKEQAKAPKREQKKETKSKGLDR